MREILQQESFKPPTIGKIVEGIVLGHKQGALYLDLGPLGTGIIYGKEFFQNKEVLEKLKPGEKILAKIVDLDNEEGYLELSVSGIVRELDFENLKKKKENEEILTVKISGANKGGLLTEIAGIPAFLPASQLLPEHYPKIESGDRSKVLKELQKFIGKEMEVKILNLSLEKRQIILTEVRKEKKDNLENLIGKEFEAEITGIFSFGIVAKFGNQEGLIQNIKSNPKESLKLGDKIKVRAEGIKNGKIILSFLEKNEKLS